MFGELNDTLKRIQETKSVIGTMVINHDGLAVRSSVDSTVTAQVMLTISILGLVKYLDFNARIIIVEFNNISFFIFRNPKYSGLLARFTQKAMKIVKEMDPSNELNFLRVSSKTNEILIAPDDNFTLVVMQENIFMRPPEKEKVETDEINYRIRD